MGDLEGIDGVTDEQFRIIYSAAWQDAITAVQIAARDGFLVERFLDDEIPTGLVNPHDIPGYSEWKVQRGLDEFHPDTTSNPGV